MANVPNLGRLIRATWVVGGVALTILSGCLFDYHSGASWTLDYARPSRGSEAGLLFDSIPYLPWVDLAYAVVGARDFRRQGQPAVSWAWIFGAFPFLLYAGSLLGTM